MNFSSLVPVSLAAELFLVSVDYLLGCTDDFESSHFSHELSYELLKICKFSAMKLLSVQQGLLQSLLIFIENMKIQVHCFHIRNYYSCPITLEFQLKTYLGSILVCPLVE